ncbi:hypothetical protein CK623_11415 [Vandammella animalimorsus]|uniref:Uncharacterized protein n=1 Tax=Vandammella animalimorsus TaxID=2029117 RepID=A0A2A2AN78_9BURK|nr:hypothetical protein [Vandammella animalimorsus]PAT39164.1 hypothetical protein CK623_11415 [Vandammella animalimorsus]
MAASEIISKTYAPAALLGQVYARVYGSSALPLEIGNVLQLELSQTEDVKKQPDLSRRGGGTHAEIRRVTEVNIKMTLADLNVTNIARAVQGSISGQDAGTSAEEMFTATLGGLYRTQHLQPSNVTVQKITNTPGTASVSDEKHENVNQGQAITFAHATPSAVVVRVGSDAGSAQQVEQSGNYSVTGTGISIEASAPGIQSGSTIWVSYTYPTATTATIIAEAGNYEVRPAGIYLLPGAANLAAGDQLRVTYDWADYAVIEALTTGPVELELIFEGLNEADSGKPVAVEIHRASQGVANAIALLQDNGFANLEVGGACLRDPRKSGSGVSQFYRVLKG